MIQNYFENDVGKYFEGGPDEVLHRDSCFSHRLLNLLTAHPDRTPCKGSTLGRFLVDVWSVSVKSLKNDKKKPTEKQLKTDPLQDLHRAFTNKNREGLWLN